MDQSSSTYGWISGFISIIAFGSFAVPIKCETSNKCQIDSLVFQTYKTAMCLLTSFIITPIFHYDFYFTPWGILSGLFWVPGGVAAVYAVKNIGLSLAQGVWSSIIVLVAFSWGVFYFSEKIHSTFMAVLAVAIMVAGLCGMSYFSSSDTKVDGKYDKYAVKEQGHCYEGIMKKANLLSIQKRRKGLAAAVFNGLWGGSIMMPMKFAPAEARGPGFVFSFAIGASIITLLLWILRYISLFTRTQSAAKAYNALPSLHLAKMWKIGGLSGLVWSIGNIASMIAVQNLGVGVGHTLGQASMLCSGLWGIFYFGEIQSLEKRIKWFFSANVTVAGILLLSYQHMD